MRISRARLARFVESREWYQDFDFLHEFGVKGLSDSDAKWRALRLPSLRGKSVLDLGCATGYLTLRAVAEGAALAVGVDHDFEQIATACAIRDHIACEPRALFFHTQIEHFLAQAISSFDVVVAASVGHYLNLPALLRRFMNGAAGLVAFELPYVPGSRELHPRREGQILVPGDRALEQIAKGHGFTVENMGPSDPLDDDVRAVFHFTPEKPVAASRRARGARARRR